MTRQREFEYTSILVHPPLNLIFEVVAISSFLMLIGLAAVDEGLEFRRSIGPVIIVLFLLIVFHFFKGRPYFITWQRTSGMRKAANRLGFEYQVSGRGGIWTPANESPPDYSRQVSSDDCDFHILSGEKNDLKVTTFDHRLTRKLKGFRDSPGNVFTHVHTWYNVVQIDGNTHFPLLTLAPAGRLDQPTIPIEGTSYGLHPTQGNIQGCQKVITPEIVEFLSENPGWIIQFESNSLTAFDARRMTLQRPIPQNLPAFVEDILKLHSLLHSQ